MKKWLRKWYRKLCVGLKASANLDKTIKAAVVASALVASTAQAQSYRHGGANPEPQPQWSVWASLWQGIKETWWFSAGAISKSFDRSSDPGQGYYNSSQPIQADHGPSGSAGGDGQPFGARQP